MMLNIVTDGAAMRAADANERIKTILEARGLLE
jgi:hypothetical protein